MRLSVDDACQSDVRVAELAMKYEIETIFYWPVEWRSLAFKSGYQPLGYAAAKDIARTFEIGSHTLTHPHLTRIPLSEALEEISESKWMLEDLFNKPVTKFCPPRGYTNDSLTQITLDFYQSQRLTKGKHLVHIHPDSGANGNMPWREAVTEDTTEIWGHSQEFDKYNLWGELEAFLNEL